jgi:hypothetical protein
MLLFDHRKRLRVYNEVMIMKPTGDLLADWATGKVESEYKDDVCLLLEHKTLRLDKDQAETSFSFYIPATSRANGLARTFIIDGIGYDLFPVPWERMERIADLGEYNTTILADAEILYARTDDDRQRFMSLRARLRANLQNPHLMYNRALEWLDTAIEVYQETLFEEALPKVRENAGHICDLLSIAVACVNRRYFKHGRTNQIKELLSMNEVPVGFTDLYERIIRVKTPDEQKRLCHDIIVSSKRFVEQHDGDAARSISAPDFSELATWYHELSYTWRRINHWCDMNDPVNAYLWCCLLQSEVDKVGAEFGITDLDIFSAFDADNLVAFRKRAESVEQKIVATIEANGVTIESYPSVEEFLKKNR